MPIMRVSRIRFRKINVPAPSRGRHEFGDATGFGKMGGEYFSLGAYRHRASSRPQG